MKAEYCVLSEGVQGHYASRVCEAMDNLGWKKINRDQIDKLWQVGRYLTENKTDVVVLSEDDRTVVRLFRDTTQEDVEVAEREIISVRKDLTKHLPQGLVLH